MLLALSPGDDARHHMEVQCMVVPTAAAAGSSGKGEEHTSRWLGSSAAL